MRESRTTSPPVRVDLQPARDPTALVHDPRQAQALALQRTVGNRATSLLIAREIRTIEGESVSVHSDAQAASAERIIKRIRRRYGIRIRSGQLVKSTKARYSSAPASETG